MGIENSALRDHDNEDSSDLLHTVNSPSGPSTDKQPSRWQSVVFDSWLCEGLSMGFSLACFIGMCGVLLGYDDKKRPEMPYDLSLNAIISVLATGCKSALVFVVGEAIGQLKWLWFSKGNRKGLLGIQTFDSASRGPLGSLAILLHHKGTSLVSLGAGILVLMLAFDPFIQQIISYPTRPTVWGNHAETALAKKSPFYYISTFGDEYMGAAYSAIWSSNFSLSPTCPTGNCTWDTFQSVGLCTRCADITNDATLDCNLPTFNSSQEDTATGPCNVVLPHGDVSDTTIEFNRKLHYFEIPQNVIWRVQTQVIEGWEPSEISYAGVTNPLTVLAYARLGVDNNPNSKHPATILNVTECSFTTCRRDYDVSVINGQASTTISSIDYGRTFVRTFAPDPKLSERSNVDTNLRYCWAPQSVPEDIVFHDTDDDILKVNTTELAFCGSSPPDSYSFTGSNKKAYRRTGPNSGWTPSVNSESMNDNVNHIVAAGFENIMKNLADSLTKLALDKSNYTAKGNMTTTEIFVEVKWPWMILPALLVLLGNVFLIATIIVNRKNKMPLWKTSTLAILFHGRDEIEDQSYTTGSKMEMVAEKVNVQLEPSDHDTRLMLRRK